MAEAKPKEMTCSVTVGGKVQLVKFELSSDYSVTLGGTWTVDGLDEREVEALRHETLLKLREELEPVAQAELDDLFEQKKDLNGG
jgi:ribosomal protein S7